LHSRRRAPTLPAVDISITTLENFWLRKAVAVTGGGEIAGDAASALERLRPAVRRVSDLFTTERPAAGAFPDYAADPALLAAYGLFFFPQSFERARIALDYVTRFREWRPAPPAGRPARVLDLGSGAGPCGLAAAKTLVELAAGNGVHLTAFDHSPAALAALREIVATTGGGIVKTETVAADLRRACAALDALPPQDLIVAGFVANEIFGADAAGLRAWLDRLCAKLAPRGLLLVLEPALRDCAFALENAASALAAEGRRHRWAPEFAERPPVSPLKAEDEARHPHEVRRWSPPASLEFLNRHLFREIGVLKFCYAAFANEPPPPVAPRDAAGVPLLALRLVSPLDIQKARLVCAVSDDARRRRFTLEIPTRGLAKRAVKDLAAFWERGDILAVTPAAMREIGGTGGGDEGGGGGALFRVAAGDLQTLYRLQAARS
jgi:SAM-dependent methyltransferase